MSKCKHRFLFLTVYMSCAIIAALSVSSPARGANAQEKLNRAIAAVIKTAGRRGPILVCQAVLPDALCDIVVEPVLSALLDEVPELAPKEDDTLEQLNQKADETINYLQRSEKLQQMIMSQFALLRENQEKILYEIEKLGQTQQELQLSIQSILLDQKYIKERIDTVVESQDKEEQRAILDKKTDVLALGYKTLRLLDRRNSMGEKINRLAGETVWEKDSGITHSSIISLNQNVISLVDGYNNGKISGVILHKKMEEVRYLYKKCIAELEETIATQQRSIELYQRKNK